MECDGFVPNFPDIESLKATGAFIAFSLSGEVKSELLWNLGKAENQMRDEVAKFYKSELGPLTLLPHLMSSLLRGIRHPPEDANGEVALRLTLAVGTIGSGAWRGFDSAATEAFQIASGSCDLMPLFHRGLLAQVSARRERSVRIFSLLKSLGDPTSRTKILQNLDMDIIERATSLPACSEVDLLAFRNHMLQLELRTHILVNLVKLYNFLTLTSLHLPRRLMGSCVSSSPFVDKLFQLPTADLELYERVLGKLLDSTEKVSVISFLSLNYFIENPYESQETVQARLGRVVSNIHASVRSLEFFYTDLLVNRESNPSTFLVMIGKELLINIAIALDLVKGDDKDISVLERTVDSLLRALEKSDEFSDIVSDVFIPARESLESFLAQI
jgi:hypothetical protein